MTAELQACEELPNKMGPNPIHTSSLSEEQSAVIQRNSKKEEDKLLSTIFSLPGERLNHNNVDYTAKEVPSLLMAHNLKIDESDFGQILPLY